MGNALLTVSADKVFLDPTGLARKGKLLWDDSFESSACGWMQLMTPAQDGSGTPGGTVSRLTYRGKPRIIARTPDVSGASIMALKREHTTYGDGRYLVEFLVSLEQVTMIADRPRYFGWGLDVARSDGTRMYFYLRWLNYDEVGASQPKRFELQQGTLAAPTFTPIKLADGTTDAVFNWPTNENKALPVYVAFIANTSTGKIEGLRISDRLKLGKLAATPDTSMIDLGAVPSESLVTFAGGLNPLINVVNRSAAAFTGAAQAIHWHRTTYLGQ